MGGGDQSFSKIPSQTVPHVCVHACAHTHTHTQKAQPYLCQLQHHSVIHIELGWNRLNEVRAAHRDDAEAGAKGL